MIYFKNLKFYHKNEHLHSIKYALCSCLMLLLIVNKSFCQPDTKKASVNKTLRLPAMVGDNMVLQRDKPVAVWGWANDGEAVTVSIDNEKHTVLTDDKGVWKAILKSKPAGGPFKILIKTDKDSLTLHNVMFGDVWVCSGQSNMQFEVKKVDNAIHELQEANFPLIRLLQVGLKASQHTEEDIDGKWQECNAQSVRDFSAVAYFFGREILQHTKVPIGLINASWGGSIIEAWMSADMLHNYPQKQDRIKRSTSDPDYIANRAKSLKLAEQKWLRKFHTETGQIDTALNLVQYPDSKNWINVNLPGYLNDQNVPVKYGISWYQKTFDIPQGQVSNKWELNLGLITDVSIIYLNGHKLGESLTGYSVNKFTIPPAYLKEKSNEILIYALNESGLTGFPPSKNKFALVNASTQSEYPLAGSWKFKQQAVHDKHNLLGPKPFLNFLPNEYTLLYNGMIAPLTKLQITGVLWYQGETNANQPDEYGLLLADLAKGWKVSWHKPDMPFYIVQLPNYDAFVQRQKALAWPRMQEVQKEIAFSMKNSGLAVTYDIGSPNQIHPTNKKDVGKRLALVVRKTLYKESGIECYGPIFKKAKKEKDSLVLSFERSSSPMVNSTNSSTLNNFKIAGKDQVFYPAIALIRGKHVVVSSTMVHDPIYVRYAFTCNPNDPNFYNQAGLPAIPFRTDTLKEW